jgi:hypothetical protein
MKKEAEFFYETFVCIYQTILSHVWVGSNHNIHDSKNLKFQNSHNQ